MKPLTQALAVTLIQALIVCSLGAKLLYDRHTRPQAWFKTARYDPNLPIRGRYLNMQIELDDPTPADEVEKKFAGSNYPVGMSFAQECGSIVMQDSKPAVVFEEGQSWNCDNLVFSRWHDTKGAIHLRLDEPVLFFIPDTATDPRSWGIGDETWVLATIPKKGPPRPIALGVKKAGETEIRRVDLK